MTERILVVSHGHPELAPGGAELAAYALFKGLQELADVKASFLGWTAALAYRRVGTPFSTFRGRPDETIFYAHGFDHFLFSQEPEILSHLEFYLKNIRPDIIHFHHYTKIGLELIAIARRLFPNVRIVVTLHEYLAICHHQGQMVKTDSKSLCYESNPHDCASCFPDKSPGDFLLRKMFIQAHFAKVDVFISPSQFLRERYINWGIPEWQIVLIENGTAAFRPQEPRQRSEGEGRGLIGFFGQINPYKGLVDLLKAFEFIAQSPHSASAGVRLMIHGANLEYNEPSFIETVTKALVRNANRVHFVGPYHYRDLPKLMAAVDWVVVPSIWWENAPLVIEEAFAHRRPVICSNIGGMAEKVSPGRDGFHFEVGNPVDLANLILRLAPNTRLWDRLQTSMRQPLATRDWVNRHYDLYRESSFSMTA